MILRILENSNELIAIAKSVACGIAQLKESDQAMGNTIKLRETKKKLTTKGATNAKKR